MLFGREFHRAAVDVSISRLPYLTVLLRFGTYKCVNVLRVKQMVLRVNQMVLRVKALLLRVKHLTLRVKQLVLRVKNQNQIKI